MERTIEHEGTVWQVGVNPAPTARKAADSGLELVFSDRTHGRKLVAPVGRAMLRTLSREGMDLDEELLRADLARALKRAETETEESAGGGSG